MRARAAAALAALLLAPLAATAEEDALAIEWTPRTTSLEAGKSYLVFFSVKYACGASRTIFLDVESPDWTESAVEDFRTSAERCQAPYRGEYREAVVLNVYPQAVEGTPGDLTLTAVDGGSNLSATLHVSVRKTTPQVDVRAPEAPLAVNATGSVVFSLDAVYTLRNAAQLRWIADAPPGWRVAVPAARVVDPGEDVTLAAPFSVGAPAEAAGAANVTLRAVLVEDGVRLAESAPTTVAFAATPLPPPPEEDIEPDAAEAPAEAPRQAPRAPIWIVGLVMAVAVAGVYALERREAGREAQEGEPPREPRENP